jgi:2-methylcitrate dehydratase PrpD
MSTTPAPVAPSAALAAFVARTAWNAVDPAMKEHARRVTAAVLAAAAAGASSGGTQSAFLTVGALGSVAEAGVVGRQERLAAPDAAFINATAARSGGGDGGAAVVVFAALATAEAAAADGPLTLLAISLGLEVARRVEDALGASHRARGYDTAGTAARVGAAAAAAAVLRLEAAAVLSAFGYAATTAAGLAAAAPGAVAALIAGLAAADAVRAARLAQAGLIGPPEPLEGRRGLLALESHGGDVTRLVEGLGVQWTSVDAGGIVEAAAGTLLEAVAALSDAASVTDLIGAAGQPTKPRS